MSKSARHWALSADAPKLAFDPKLAANLAARHFKFTCLVPADSVYERVALEVKRQLAAASVDMQVKEVPQDELMETAGKNDWEALLVDTVSGPSLFRLYQRWLSGGRPFTIRHIDSPLIDAALDRIRHASSDADYRAGVTAFQQAVVDDPPAIFLAWGERARAVSRRFDVPSKPGRDILTTLRLWKPSADQGAASRN